MWWGSRRKHDVVFISQHPINLYFLHHNPRPHHHLSHSPPSQHLRLSPPSARLPRTYSFPEHIPPILSPPNPHKTSPPTTPALKTALPAAPPARLQSCPCLHAPVSTPAQHPPSRLLHPHPIPHLPGPPQLEQTPPPPHQGRNLPFCHQASHWPATSRSILWNNRSPHPSAPLQDPPTPPAFAHQRRARRPPPGPPHAASRPCTLSQAPPHFLSSHRHIIKQPARPPKDIWASP